MEKLSKKALKEQYKNRTVIGGVYCIKCNSNLWIRATKNMQGSKNRFAFSVLNNYCPETCMIESWNQFGASNFTFEILEELEKKETQTDREFSDDVNTLLEIWTEKLKS
ncbi:GIY-YIG nuclease family protein [Acetivibrio cellulolyticus]|uniref:GIY-YIG nuclease family protein n=1 Tax=Acetivibrio cellulolyticus TaxID=35830 RepID=UPI0001E2F602|nr:GIY-YIG nuclease family protein [Acetivibrio cellulolyticus]